MPEASLLGVPRSSLGVSLLRGSCRRRRRDDPTLPQPRLVDLALGWSIGVTSCNRNSRVRLGGGIIRFTDHARLKTRLAVRGTRTGRTPDEEITP